MPRVATQTILVALARAVGGAIVFSVPLLMTMEMWELGFYMDRLRLALFLLIAIPLLIALSYHAGFEDAFRLRDEVRDAFIAYAVGFFVAAVMLTLLGEISAELSLDEMVGKVSLQAVPGAIGALLARSQLGGKKAQEKEERYAGEIFLMAVGALYLAFNIAPTEEVVLIAYKIQEWHAIALALLSLLLMHAFVYAAGFHGQHEIPEDTPHWHAFLRFTVLGYALALAISVYVLWTFGRLEGTAAHEIIMTAIVLGFPAALGAAAARLIL